MIAEEVVRAAGLGLVVVRDGAVVWLNDAARELVASCGGDLGGPGSPVAALADVRSGPRRTTTRWRSPTGGIRWWQVAAIAARRRPDAVRDHRRDRRLRHRRLDRGVPRVAAQPDRVDRQARLVDLEARRRQRRVLRGARRGGRVASRRAARPARAWSRGCTSTTGPELVAALDRAIEQRGAVRRRRPAATWTGPDSSSGCSSGAARCSATPRADPPRSSASSATSPSTTTTGPSSTFLAEHDPLTGVANRRRIGSRHRRLRGRPAGRRAVDDRHRQLQGHQRPARPRRRRPDHPQGGRRRRRADRAGRAARAPRRRRVRRDRAGRHRVAGQWRWPSGSARRCRSRRRWIRPCT